jgi:small subunit ribosomal protein S16
MLAIRLQRTGRKGLAHYRMIVQEAQKSPKSEKVVDRIGHYNPHTKELVIDKEKAEVYLKNGAQPSDKVARLLKSEKVNLPVWVQLDTPQKRKTKNIEKLRKNRPAEPKAPAGEGKPTEPTEPKEPVEETVTEAETEKVAETSAPTDTEKAPEVETVKEPEIETPKAEESTIEESVESKETVAEAPADEESPEAKA